MLEFLSRMRTNNKVTKITDPARRICKLKCSGLAISGEEPIIDGDNEFLSGDYDKCNEKLSPAKNERDDLQKAAGTENECDKMNKLEHIWEELCPMVDWID